MSQNIQKEEYVTRIMLDMGVPAHLKGYHYLRQAIMMAEQNLDVVSSVTKVLYPTIATLFKTTDQRVERAIRNAIEVSWERGNEELMEKLLGIQFKLPKADRRIVNILQELQIRCDWIGK